ncbi:MAG: DUF898 family protein, partial [Inhella sp.]
TLTLYWPFARARRIAYFQNNTQVGGHPLGFHADPWKMFRGYVVVLVLGLGYWAVTRLAPDAGWMALLAVALVWPLLWKASLQFRLRNTSWRGVRLAFVGDTRGAYGVLLPFFVPTLGFAFALPQGPAAAPPAWVVAAAWLSIATVLATPWLLMRLKRYQHGGYVFTQQRLRLEAGALDLYALVVKSVLVSLAAMGLVLGLVAVLLFLVMGMGQSEVLDIVRRPGLVAGGALAVAVLGFVLLYLVVPLVGWPYFTARLQDLLWSGSRSALLRFHSRLRFRDLARVQATNWVLILLTLGLYWPFAAVRSTRLRLEAVEVQVAGSVDHWLAQAAAAPSGVLGDAAGDFLGIDMGL